jgi:two-component system, LytTR family, sensor histidine kinase AlgZ
MLVKRVLRGLAWNAAGAAAGVAVFTDATLATPLSDVARIFGISLLFSICISTLCFTVLSRLGPYLLRRVSSPVYWTAMIAAMLALATAGSLLALVILSAVGFVEMDAILRNLRGSLKISMAITLAIGISVTVMETMRGRLERALVALRTKERDEAEARRVATEAQLASLESRVQPHFLFNTLNSIAALIPQDPAGAERMTGQLASILRSSLDTATTPLVPLAQELRSVGDYLEIERVRFGERLHYTVAVPAELNQVLVPRLALQTLVENSVKFAVTPRREGGRLALTGEALPESARLTVEDDGPGFAAAAAVDHHGLALLRDRLRLSFGDRGGLEVNSAPGRTRVSVTVPR